MLCATYVFLAASEKYTKFILEIYVKCESQWINKFKNIIYSTTYDLYFQYKNFTSILCVFRDETYWWMRCPRI
jgi:hypothetical protein